jgi:UDP-N-acetyl-D-glucosamine dehydrogenase
MEHMEQIKKRMGECEAVIGIIGLGYVGLPLVMRFAQEGFRVLGFDNDAAKVGALNRGESPIQHLQPADVRAALDPGFTATTDLDRAGEPDALLLMC